MKPLSELCQPRETIFDPSKRDTVLDITDLIERKINAPEFFAENHITEGMRTLLREGFRRLEGKSSQGVFKLTQAMGGGKTHSMLALGLLADNPHLRETVMGHIYRPEGLGIVRVLGFSGRERDAPLGIWGAIADQLGKKCEQRLFTTQTMLWSEVKKRAATQPNWQWHLPGALDNLKDDCIHKDYWRDDGGGYVRKGPFPKGSSEVRVQENERDDNTGRVKLKLTAVNADTIYAEVGGPASTASQKVESNVYETSELRVSFLAVDSTGEHATGIPIEWSNRITLKHRVFQHGDNRMVELKAAPPVAKIHYTTDGSAPKLGGGLYDEPFTIPRGSKVVLAFAERDQIESPVLEIPIDWSEAGGVKVDPLKPAVWKRPQEVKATQDAYKLVERMEKTHGAINVQRLMVNGDKNHWVELTTDEQLRLDAEKLKSIMEAIRSLLGGGQVDINYSALHFPTGQDLLDWVAEAKDDLKAGEVDQYAGDKA